MTSPYGIPYRVTLQRREEGVYVGGEFVEDVIARDPDEAAAVAQGRHCLSLDELAAGTVEIELRGVRKLEQS